MAGVVTALILLPLQYNPDRQGRRRDVSDRQFKRTAEEVAQRFGGGTLHLFREEAPRGYWWDRGVLDRDTHALLEVDIADTRGERARLVEYARQVLLRRFKQQAIYVKFVGPVDVLVVTEKRIR